MSDKAPLILPSTTLAVQVRFSDTDMMGHISSMSYGHWTECARAEYFEHIPEPSTQIPWFVMVHVGLDFHREGRFGEEFVIYTRTTKLGNKSMHLQHEITGNGELKSTVKVVMSAFDRESRRSVLVPSHWRPSAEQAR